MVAHSAHPHTEKGADHSILSLLCGKLPVKAVTKLDLSRTLLHGSRTRRTVNAISGSLNRCVLFYVHEKP